MKTSVARFRFSQFFLISLLCGALTGCASLFGRQLSEEEQLAESDPVAASALKLRRGHESAAVGAHSRHGHSSLDDSVELDGSNEIADLEAIRLSAAKARRDVVTGMSSDEVRAIWGEPREVEHAELPGSGNERWTYYEGLSSRWSLSTARVIYFESGRVAGWEVQKP